MTIRKWLINVGSRLVAKRHLARVQEIPDVRRSFHRMAQLGFHTPPLSLFLEDTLAERPALWVSSGVKSREKVIYYIHGGGYVAGSPETHKNMLAALSQLCGIQACLIDYRLAPEHAFPAAIDDVLAGYLALLERGYAPENIIIGGDSAGGGAVLVLLSELCKRKIAPRAAFALSPLTDLTLSGESLRSNAKSEAMLPVERIDELRDMYLQGADPADPRASPLFVDFPHCPPVLLQASDSEILRDDTCRMAAVLEAQGVEVETYIWSDLPHVWQIFHGWLPDADLALLQVAQFIKGLSRT
ncbi:alpha/beta hydrolase [Profundibacter sp.]